MSSLSWDFPSSSTNPSEEDDDRGEVDGLGRPDGVSADHDESTPVDIMEREPSEREQIEALERELLEQLEREQIEPLEHEQIESLERERGEQLEREQIEALEREQLARLARLGAAEIEMSERSEREQLRQLEQEQLEQLRQLEQEQLEHQQNTHVAASRPSEPSPAEQPRPDVQPSWAPIRGAQIRGDPSAPVADERPGIGAEARAAQFLAAAAERQALDEAARGLQSSALTTEHRELNEPARAARAIVEHRHRNLVEANALLTDARRVLAPIAYRGLSDRIYRRRKVILAIGEAVSLAVAFSAAFDVAPLEALLLSGAIALAFVIAGDLGGILRLTAERSRLSAAVEDSAAHLDPRYLHILYYERQPWLSIVGGATAGLFALAAVTVGVLRAANRGSLGLAAGLGLLTLSLAIAAGLSSWQHASIGADVIDHLQREEEAATRRLKRAAAARVLRQPQILTAVRSEELETPSFAPDVDWQAQAPAGGWQAPAGDWQAPTVETRATRPTRAGRAAREKPARSAKREKGSGGLVGAAAARGAVFFATLPGKLRRSEKPAKGAKSAKSAKSAKAESEDMWAGEGPGAGGESAGPMSDISFRPPVIIQRKFP